MVKPDDICRLPCRAADRQQTSKIIGGDLKARDSAGGYQIVSSAMRDRDIARAIVHPPAAFPLRPPPFPLRIVKQRPDPARAARRRLGHAGPTRDNGSASGREKVGSYV